MSTETTSVVTATSPSASVAIASTFASKVPLQFSGTLAFRPAKIAWIWWPGGGGWSSEAKTVGGPGDRRKAQPSVSGTEAAPGAVVTGTDSCVTAASASASVAIGSTFGAKVPLQFPGALALRPATIALIWAAVAVISYSSGPTFS